MSSFPDIVGSPRYDFGDSYARTLIFPAAVTQDMGHGRLVQYQKHLTPRWAFKLGHTQLTREEAESIDAHVFDNFGPRYWFHFYDWRPFWWRWVPVGVGDGATSTFDIPAKGAIDIQVFVDGVTPVFGDFAPAGGIEGVGRVTLYAPIAYGKRVSAAFYGRRRFAVRYRKDKGQPRTRRDDLALPRYAWQSEMISWKEEGVL